MRRWPGARENLVARGGVVRGAAILSGGSALVDLAAAIDDLGHVVFVLAEFRGILEAVLVLVFLIVVIRADAAAVGSIDIDLLEGLILGAFSDRVRLCRRFIGQRRGFDLVQRRDGALDLARRRDSALDLGHQFEGRIAFGANPLGPLKIVEARAAFLALPLGAPFWVIHRVPFSLCRRSSCRHHSSLWRFGGID